VVDLHLPDLHGLTVIERLRGDGVSCPVVAVTGYYVDPERRTTRVRPERQLSSTNRCGRTKPQ
jgi:CheY-like chemotaxis protein